MNAAVICRPRRAYWHFVWLILFVGGLFALLPLSSPRALSRTDWGFLLFLDSCFFLPAVGTTIWIVRAQVTADANGLRWRSLGKWRTARWGEVIDFYDKLPPPDNRNAKIAAVVVTRNGTVKIGQDWVARESLREIVAQNAVNARAREWGILGTRPEDAWPRVFRYDTLGNRLLPLWAVVVLAFWAWLAVPKLVRTYGAPEWIWTLASAAVFLLFLCAKVSLPMLAWSLVRRRFAQHIIVSPDKIVFEDSKRRIESSWADVTDYFVVTRGVISLHTIEARSGTFDFLGGISDSRLLAIIVNQWAQNAAVKEWRQRGDVETLGGVTAKWSSGREGVGERIYHYRTRTNRAMLWFCGVFAAMIPGGLGLQIALGMTIKGDWKFIAGLCSLLVAGTLWAVWRYYAAAIRTNDDGITQYAPFRKRHFAWTEIAEYCGKSGDYIHFVVQNNDGQKIIFWSGIVGENELKDEIERRAVNSRTNTWETLTQSNLARTQHNGR